VPPPPPPVRPLTLPEQLHAAATSLGALGVYPGTTLRQVASACAAPAPPPTAQLAFSSRLHATLSAHADDAGAPPPTVAPRVALRAAADALRWELRTLSSVDWSAALLEEAPAEVVRDAARTLEHAFRCGTCARAMCRSVRSKGTRMARVCALTHARARTAAVLLRFRLHADVCAQLAALERSQARAARWRDGLLRALALGDTASDVPLSPPPPPPLPPHVGPPEAWLPPCAWALLPCGSPAQLWPPDDITTLTYTVRARGMQHLVCLHTPASADGLHRPM
jgi:hypothetical protein